MIHSVILLLNIVSQKLLTNGFDEIENSSKDNSLSYRKYVYIFYFRLEIYIRY